jgi:predicted RNase H-like HicB family nuclease
MSLDEYMKVPYSVVVRRSVTTQGNPVFVARHPELPGCMGQGATPEEAKADLVEARRLVIEDMLESGEEPPKPKMAVGAVRLAAPVPQHKLVAHAGPALDNIIVTETTDTAVQFDDIELGRELAVA